MNPWQHFETGAQADGTSPRSLTLRSYRSHDTFVSDRSLPARRRAYQWSDMTVEMDALYQYVRGALPYGVYGDHPHIPFAYEMLEGEGWEERTERIVRSWLTVQQGRHPFLVTPADKFSQVDAHLCQVEAEVQRRRDPVQPSKDLLHAWCMFSLKAVDSNGWRPILGGLSTDKTPQATVFLATEDLGPDNGFFMRLQRGEWVCFDGTEGPEMPSTGGGRGLFFALRI